MLACRPKGRPASLSRAAWRYVARARSTSARHVGEQELQSLELADRLAELLALPGVAHRVRERCLGDAGADGRDAEASGVERGEGDPHAVALVADPVRDRDQGSVEEHLGGDVAGQAHLLLGGAERHALRVGRDNERADSPRLGSSLVRAKRM